MIEDVRLQLNASIDVHTGNTLWSAIFAGHWRRLHTLHLEDVVTTEADLLSFVSRHGKHLKNLTFWGIRLHRRVADTSESDSVIRALWSFPFLATVHTFDLEGIVSCCGEEHW